MAIIIYLLKNVNVETLSTGGMKPSETNNPPIEV
jgi:hypothetical protein